jgi:tight adherence protein B
MSPLLLFVLLLVLTFAVVMYFLKPSATEVAVEQHIASIQETRTAAAPGVTILKLDALSSNAMVDDLLKQLPGTSRIAHLIRQAGRRWSVSSVLGLTLAAAVVGSWIASLVLPSSLLVGAVGVGLCAAPFIYLLVLRGIRFRRFDALLPEAVDLMARGLRAGHSIAAVLEMVGSEIADPIGSEFRALHKEQSLGLPMREAVMNLIDRVPRDDMRFLATALLLQKESGGNLAQILDKTSSVVRERARLRGQLRIYTAQGRITGWILGFAPFVMFGLISLVNHEYEKALFTDPFGLKMVYGALALMVVGLLIIRKVIDIRI